jgi:DNA-binding MarR family transcriptional regulator
LATADAAAPGAAAKRARRLSREDFEALGAFRQALRRFLAFSEAAALGQNLTPQQHQALLAIRAHRGNEPMSISQLADCLIIKNHSAVGLVSRLRERGLVERQPSAYDRRRIILRLTSAAERKLEVISRDNLRELKGSAEAIGDLLQTLKRLELRGVWTTPKRRAARRGGPAGSTSRTQPAR